ncbi:hypothetical protein JW826_05555 [Candidatus Woesearchaeota archaeon]|nr:hypothetical protein [Candidatus Woesearchaeota archaeon]
MNRISKSKAFLAVFLIMALTLSACSNFKGSKSANKNFEDNKYYQGYEGVDVRFSQSSALNKLYYYGNSEHNEFIVEVEVANKGSSMARGGIFLSGYDPNMIEIQGIRPDPSSNGRACQLNFGNMGTGKYDLTLRCDGGYLGMDSDLDAIDLSINNFLCAGSKIDVGRLGSALCGDMRFTRDANAGGNSFSYNFYNKDIDVEYANHGRLFISLSQIVNFEKNMGQEYILDADDYLFPGGETTYIPFNGNIVNWPPGLDQTQQKFLITNCYMYTTYASPTVCIDPSPFSESRKVCVPKTYTGTSGQGAPVAVTYVEQENTPRESIFQIHVKNVGGGRVYAPGAAEICSPYSPVRVTNNDLNIVLLGDIRVSGDLQRLTCTPGDFIRLDPKTNEGVVTCRYELPFSGLKSAYEAPLVVELWYGYEKTIEKSVTIKRAI